MTELTIERFYSKVAITSNAEKCWNWLGRKTAKGYGQFDLNTKNIRAHRFSYIKTHIKKAE